MERLHAELPARLRSTAATPGNRAADLHPHLAETRRGVHASGLRGRTVVVSGASRGIGHAIALRCAQGGANVCCLARSSAGVSFGPGTVEGAVADIEAAGGVGLAVPCGDLALGLSGRACCCIDAPYRARTLYVLTNGIGWFRADTHTTSTRARHHGTEYFAWYIRKRVAKVYMTWIVEVTYPVRS